MAELRSSQPPCHHCGKKRLVMEDSEGNRFDADPCIADLLAALNGGGHRTVAHCCGHGFLPGVISLVDGRQFVIMTMEEAQAVQRLSRVDINGWLRRQDEEAGGGTGTVPATDERKGGHGAPR